MLHISAVVLLTMQTVCSEHRAFICSWAGLRWNGFVVW